MCEEITRRYLKRRAGLVQSALSQLAPSSDEPEERGKPEDPSIKQKQSLNTPSLNTLRHKQVHEALISLHATSVADLGCGEGKLLDRLAADPRFTRVIGGDVSLHALRIAEKRLERRGRSAELLHTSLLYQDRRLRGLDAITLVEVIEHIEPDRLPAMAQALFLHARPRAVIITTPNQEHNALFAGLRPGQLRHSDHRFEWTRAEFAAWIAHITSTYPYSARLLSIGTPDPLLGPPTQGVIFTRESRT